MLRARFKFDPNSSPMHYKDLDGVIFTVEEEILFNTIKDKMMWCSHSWLADKTSKDGRFVIWESCLEYLTED